MKKLNINLLMMLGIFILSSAGLPAVTHAEGWYAGIGTGLARYNGFNSDTQTVAGSFFSGSSAEGGADFNLFGGYKFNPYFGVEGGYTNFNQATATLSGTNSFGQTIALSDTLKAYGITLSAVGSYSFNKVFSVYGKAGVDFWNDNESGTCTINNIGCSSFVFPIPSSWNNSANGASPLFGGGFSFSWNQNDSIQLGYNVFQKIGNSDTGAGNTIKTRDVSVISVDYIYSF